MNAASSPRPTPTPTPTPTPNPNPAAQRLPPHGLGLEAPGGPPERAAQAAALLNAGETAAFGQHLAGLQAAGIGRLELRGQTVDAKGMACLAAALDAWARQHGALPVTAIDASNARLHCPEPVLATLTAHRGAGIDSLDFSGTRSLSDGASGEDSATELDEAALQAIIGFVGTSTALHTLTLDRQPALGLLPFIERLAAGLHGNPEPPMCRLFEALKTSSVKALAMRGCSLSPHDWGNLERYLRDVRLTSLDLDDNETMGSVWRPDACGILLCFVAALERQTSLTDLRLPQQATEWFLAGCAGLPPDHRLWPRLALHNNHTLRRLPPLMDSTAQALAPLRQTLDRNHAALARLKVAALALHHSPFLPPGFPPDLKRRIVGEMARQSGLEPLL